MSEDDELLDLVDETDAVVGAVRRGDYQIHSHGPYVRYAEAFIQNSSGQLWIPRRNTHKKIAPGGLDFSMAEHVGSGESYLAAAVRGFAEELNLTVKPSELRLLVTLSPSPDVPFFSAVYLYKSDAEPDYNREDYSGYQWISPAEIATCLEKGELAKDTLARAVKQLFIN